MKKIVKNLADIIGNTPLLEPVRYNKDIDAAAQLLLKLEAFNPGGSVKDRVAKNMIYQAELQGILRPGATIIEPTSGNTGIGLAWICAIRGYRLILTMPDSMSIERRKLLLAYGAEIVLTPGKLGMAGAVARAEELRNEIEGSVILDQFNNPANPQAHFISTGHEIWRDTSGRIDIFVAGVGTGGTISGVGRFLKSKKPAVQIVAVEPAESPVLSGGKPGPTKFKASEPVLFRPPTTSLLSTASCPSKPPKPPLPHAVSPAPKVSSAEFLAVQPSLPHPSWPNSLTTKARPLSPLFPTLATDTSLPTSSTPNHDN